MATVSVQRTGNPTAVNTQTGMLVQDASTAAPTEKVPSNFDGVDRTGSKDVWVSAVEVVGIADGAAVGAGVFGVVISDLGPEIQRFIASAIGGQNATGDQMVVGAALYPVKIPVVPGKEFTPNSFMWVTDLGNGTVTLTIHVSDIDPWPEVELTKTDVRCGLVTALNTALQLQVVDQSTTAGDLAIPVGFTEARFIHLCGASDSAATGRATASVTLTGGALKTGNQRYGVSGSGGVLATSMIAGMAAQAHSVRFALVANQGCTVNGFFYAADVGNYAVGFALTMAKLPGGK